MKNKHRSNRFLIVVVAVVIIVGGYVWQSRYSRYHATETPPKAVATVKSPTNTAKTTIVQVTNEGGKVVSSADNSFKLTVPKDWFYDTVNDTSNKSLLNVAPDKNLLAAGSINFYALPNQCVADLPTQGTQSQSYSYESVALNNANGFRIEQVDGASSSTPNQKFITYKLCKDNIGYFANYALKPDATDYISAFDDLVQSWKF